MLPPGILLGICPYLSVTPWNLAWVLALDCKNFPRNPAQMLDSNDQCISLVPSIIYEIWTCECACVGVVPESRGTLYLFSCCTLGSLWNTCPFPSKQPETHALFPQSNWNTCPFPSKQLKHMPFSLKAIETHAPFPQGNWNICPFPSGQLKHMHFSLKAMPLTWIVALVWLVVRNLQPE